MQVIDWQVVVDKHGPTVWRTAYRLLENHTDAADCFQETFVSALELSKRQKIKNFAPLLIRLATVRAIDRLRQRFREQKTAEGQADWTNLPAANPGPAQYAQARELASQLRAALTRLPPNEAQVFCLRYLNNMSYRQIAKQLGVKTNAAGVLLHRARTKLRAALEHSHEES